MVGPLYIGVDLGTSGCRAIAIDERGAVHGEARTALPEPTRAGPRVEQDPQTWWPVVVATLGALLTKIPASKVAALAVDATSGTVLLADSAGEPLGPALLYNDARAIAEARRITAHAPADSAAHGPSSGLAKILWLIEKGRAAGARYIVNQSDWITGRLSGRWGLSDANNCLKLGYDPVARRWPAWVTELGIHTEWLPEVLEPGTPIGTLAPAIAAELGLSPDLILKAGTTDSTAAFLATGAREPGEAVTSLGSTLVLKVLSARPIFARGYGIYSQPLGRLWLAGGGSNSGGAVLRALFTQAELDRLTPALRPDEPTGLDYYPLLTPGERFPVCDPALRPRLEPRPSDDRIFLQGLLEGMARIELNGYQRLEALGAPYPRSVRSVGGGARNVGWTSIRQRLLGVPMVPPRHTEAAYGAALLAAGLGPVDLPSL